MGYSIKGWPEGHPQLVTIDGYPCGYATPQCPDPTSEENKRKRDGYAASFKALYRSYKRRALKDGVKFDLTETDFWRITCQPCIVCAEPPSQGKLSRYNNPYIYNGIDRLDSDGNYQLGNVVACCWAHNRIKSNLTYQEIFKNCLALVLSELSKTATQGNDIDTLERLIDLFPNVRFLREHHALVWKILKDNPRTMRLTMEMALPRHRRGEKRYLQRPDLSSI